MKSGMKIQLPEFGETQVIGELKDGKFVNVWGIGAQGVHIMNPKGDLLKDILKACRKADNSNILAQAKLIQSDLENRLDWIREAQEKINKETLCELDT